MVKNASNEFIEKAKEMSDEELLRTFDAYCAQMKALEVERLQCYNRMMEIREIQDVLGGEIQAMDITAHWGRKLK